MNTDEVIAATRSWLEKAVIGLNLCPFAKAVYLKNQVRLIVSSAKHTDSFLEELDRELGFLAAADPEVLDTTLLIHPTLLSDFLDFNDFLELAESAVIEQGLEGTIQIASFHPHFQFEGTAPENMGNYTNRAPFPILHLLREASIERVTIDASVAETIVQRNIKTLETLGQDGWNALWKSSVS